MIRMQSERLDMLMRDYNRIKNEDSLYEDDVPSSRDEERRRGKRPVVEDEE